MSITNQVLSRLEKISQKTGLEYLLGSNSSLGNTIVSIASVGSFADKLDEKFENYFKAQGIHIEFFKEINAEFRSRWKTFDCILIGSLTRYAHFKKALLEIGIPIHMISHPENFCQLKANFFSADNTLPTWPKNEKSYDEKINWLSSNEEHLSKAYHLIEPCSRDLFIDKLATYLRPDCINLFIEFIERHSMPFKILGPIPLNGDNPAYGVENFFYFFNDIFKLNDNCVYVDIGAHIGDSLSAFLKRCEALKLEYAKIFCFEPDYISFKTLTRSSNNIPKVTCINAAILNEKKMIFYNSLGSGGGSISTDTVRKDGRKIQTGRLSDFIKKIKIDLIKWDTPGPNITMKVLSGCEETISQDKPNLLIGAYHNVNDIFEIPIKIKNLNEHYKIFLRHNSWLFTETVYYCIDQRRFF